MMEKPKIFRRLKVAMNILILVMAGVCYKHSSAAPSSEIQTLSVAYLYNFMKLSEWPVEGLPNELTLCITQDGDFAKELDSLAGKEIQIRPLRIKRLMPGDDASLCQLLFLPSEEKPVRLQEWLKILQDAPVLTVSDQNEFLEQGGMIALVNDGEGLQFEVNLERVERVGIKLSSKMLQIARQVRGK
jgi:YfiR/HmsC-like